MSKIIIFDLVLWFCLYCMYTQNNYVGSAEMAVYLLIGFNTAFSSIALLGAMFIDNETITSKDVIKYNPPSIGKRIYAKVTNIGELVILVVSGYLVCGILYAFCFLATIYLHEKLLELKNE